ncbi:MAG: xanthine dehydrogenase YagR molybdenum-binding subunit [Mycobacterium sp.]|jgi:xanthine dehydrogenase YagR molybdenum-binding subunit|nr:xanthine dehydrogenase YagR molybdenum-binding subunit [Mycobacterium sp.]MDT5140769.1 xanthine dehydrogenase YagR molybdenum-binding subunit [Mycobacterium sp.]MDT5171175.1 xanthine dehydrogenase YagR molybdenum-binding subunit [Mycobacterium sp.]MDT5340893.1 xanthine dehydrogenase YagR molybdenum-binding subunit [Mycobacterium sp.]MDT7739933.1 xanthine dehydrogenase YagR molybdenum-binding subunit [Mycobacterium sp.]
MAEPSSQVGRAISRVEGYDKVIGRARYTADVAVADLVYAVLVQSEVAHGHVSGDSLRTCAERASAAPGVLHVLTPLNCPPLGVLPPALTDNFPMERRPPLSDFTVQHVGQHLAVVVADTPENATHAASLFDLEYLAAPALLTAQDVLEHRVAPDENDGQIRHGTCLPDQNVTVVEEKLQDHRGGSSNRPRRSRLSAGRGQRNFVGSW